MPTNIATLTGTIGFKVDGEREVERALTRITQGMALLEGASGTTSIGVERVSHSLREAVEELGEATTRFQRADQWMKETGRTSESLGAEIASTREEIRQLNAEIGSLASGTGGIDPVRQKFQDLGVDIDEVQRRLNSLNVPLENLNPAALEAFAKSVGVTADQLKEIANIELSPQVDTSRLEELQGQLGAVQERLDALLEIREILSTKGMDDAVGKIDVLIQKFLEAKAAAGELTQADLDIIAPDLDKTTKAADGTARSIHGLSQTSLTGLISLLRTGRPSAALFAQGLQGIQRVALRLATALTKLQFALVAVAGVLAAIPLFIITKMAIDIGKIASAAVEVPPKIDAISDSVGQLAGVTESKLNAALAESVRLFESIGSTRPAAAAGAVAQLASVAQFQSPGTEDFDQVMGELQQAISSLNFAPLADLGVNVEAGNRALQDMAENGFDRATRASYIWNTALEHLSANLEDLQAQAEREQNSVRGVFASFKEAIDAVANTDAVKEAMERLGVALRKLFQSEGFKKFVEVAVQAFIRTVTATAKVIEWLGKLFDAVGMVTEKFEVLGETAFQVFNTAFAGIPSLIRALGDEELAAEGAEQASSEWAKVWKDIDLGETLRELSNLGSALFDLEGDVESAERRMTNFRESLKGGFSITGQLRQVAQAFLDIRDGLDPGEAIAYAETVNNALDQIATVGTAKVLQSFEAMRTQFQNLREAGILDDDEFAQAIAVVEGLEQAAKPLIDEVKRLEDEYGVVEDAVQQFAGTMSGPFDSSVMTSQSNVANLEGQLASLDGTISAVRANAAQGIFIPTGVGSVPIAAGGTGRGIRPGQTGADFVRQTVVASSANSFTTQRDNSLAGGRAALRQETESRRDVRVARERSNEIKASQDLAKTFADSQQKLIDLFDLTPSRRGGGGGGDRSASAEDIRKLFQEVNRAIAIASRGGVRIGTAGNAIPFEPGSFLNAEGGGLQVDQILIRGVWDFADPAARRQIVRELRNALRDLEAEL